MGYIHKCECICTAVMFGRWGKIMSKLKLEANYGCGLTLVSQRTKLYCLKCQKGFIRKVFSIASSDGLTDMKVQNPKCNKCKTTLVMGYDTTKCKHCGKMSKR